MTRRIPNTESPTEVRQFAQRIEARVSGGSDPGHSHTGASLSGIDISADTNLAVTAPIILTGDTLSLNVGAVNHNALLNTHNLTTDINHNTLANYAANQHVVLPGSIAAVLMDHNLAAHTALGLFDAHADVDHNQTTNYVADQHVAHTGVTLTAGSGLTGTGDISASRTFDLDINSLAAAAIAAGDFVPFWDITATATNKKILFSGFEAALNHDALANYVADKHVAHAGVSIATAATSGISGGGTIAATRNLTLNINGLTGESAIAAADTLAFYDDGVGNRKITLSELSTALGAADEKVKVDSGATAGYLGVAAGDGVLRTNASIAWTDGGNFVTLALSHLGIESLADPNADKILFWDDTAGACEWLTIGAGLDITLKEISWVPYITRYSGHMLANQDIPPSEYTKVIFDDDEFDGGGDVTAGVFTSPASGYYVVCAGAQLAALGIVAGKWFSVFIYVDGVATTQQGMKNIGVDVNAFDIKFSDVLYIPSGKDVELYVWHNDTVNREIVGGVATFLSVHRLS